MSVWNIQTFPLGMKEMMKYNKLMKGVILVSAWGGIIVSHSSGNISGVV